MNGTKSARPTGAAMEEPIPSSQQTQPTAKRKAPDDSNPLTVVAKKLKKERSATTNKRKLLNGEEQPGGLVIVRASSSRPPSALGDHTSNSSFLQPPPRPPSSQSHRPFHTPAGSSQPPAKKLKASSSHSQLKVSSPVGQTEPELEEDVRRMQSEADHLRRLSRPNESLASSLNPQFKFPSQPKSKPLRQTVHSRPSEFRQGAASDHEKKKERRKSSISSRGRRISTSFENTGVISQPHHSVSESSFYKHIDMEIPDPARVRQLLIWVSSRATTGSPIENAPESSSKHKPKNAGKDPPPLSAKTADIMRGTQEDLIQLLADKQIDTNTYGRPDPNRGVEKKIQENEQNMKNRQREIKFTSHIERMKKEEQAWIEVEQFYNARITELKKSGEIGRKSDKAKGKRRATSEDLRDLPTDYELPEKFRAGAELARKILSEELSDQSSVALLDDLQFKMDRLHTFVNSALQTTRTAETDLDYRFSLLSTNLAARSTLQTVPHSAQSALSTYLPPRTAPTDPHELMRALSRVDAERPPGQVGDAARRAVRELQRANDASGGFVPERRLTGVPPLTPRKLAGTPRRGTTPSRDR